VPVYAGIMADPRSNDSIRGYALFELAARGTDAIPALPAVFATLFTTPSLDLQINILQALPKILGAVSPEEEKPTDQGAAKQQD
jgi:hypothetical protein